MLMYIESFLSALVCYYTTLRTHGFKHVSRTFVISFFEGRQIGIVCSDIKADYATARWIFPDVAPYNSNKQTVDKTNARDSKFYK